MKKRHEDNEKASVKEVAVLETAPPAAAGPAVPAVAAAPAAVLNSVQVVPPTQQPHIHFILRDS